jgi:hypothetical protein
VCSLDQGMKIHRPYVCLTWGVCDVTLRALVLGDLHTLNAIERLADGTVPLTIWLENAVALVSNRVESTVFITALQTCGRHKSANIVRSRGRKTSTSISVTEKITQARRWLIIASLLTTAANLLFFILAPSFGYPLDYPQNLRVMQLGLPVVLGYLGSMTTFFFQPPQKVSISPQALPFLNLMVKGPVIIFALASTAAIVAFGYANRISAPPGLGMSVDILSLTITACLGLLTVTTNAMVAFLFNAGTGDHGAPTGGTRAAGDSHGT